MRRCLLRASKSIRSVLDKQSNSRDGNRNPYGHSESGRQRNKSTKCSQVHAHHVESSPSPSWNKESARQGTEVDISMSQFYEAEQQDQKPSQMQPGSTAYPVCVVSYWQLGRID